MTALSATSSNGYSYAASTQTAKTSAHTTNSGESSAKNNSAHDILTISAEGLDALSKIENAQLYSPENSTVDLKPNPQKKIELGSVALKKYSNHYNTVAWSLGLYDTVQSQPYWAMSREAVLPMRAQLQQNREQIDDKITNILESNDIVLNKNETLNLNVNQRGEIMVGEGISEEKIEKIETLLNNDESLGLELLFTSAEQKWAVNGDTVDNEWYEQANYILTDALLRQEYGVSLDDFELSDPAQEGELGSYPRHSIVPKERTDDIVYQGDHELLDKILNKEMMLYEDIKRALGSLEDNGGDFEVEYAYKNGVTIEKGATDQAALNRASKQFTPIFSLFDAKSTITASPDGQVLDAAVIETGSFESDKEKATLGLKSMLLGMSSDDYFLQNNASPTKSRLQQHVFDMQRLFQFNTGMNEEVIKAMNVTFTIDRTGFSF